MCWCVSFLLYLNNSAESCRLRQLSEFHLHSATGCRDAHENITTVPLGRLCIKYLISDLDEQDEDNQNEQIVKDTDCSDDDVDDLESKVTTFRARSRMLARYDVRSSDSDGDVVTSFVSSLDNSEFSITARSRLIHRPQHPALYCISRCGYRS